MTQETRRELQRIDRIAYVANPTGSSLATTRLSLLLLALETRALPPGVDRDILRTHIRILLGHLHGSVRGRLV